MVENKVQALNIVVVSYILLIVIWLLSITVITLIGTAKSQQVSE